MIVRKLATLICLAAALGTNATPSEDHYAMADFEKLRKFDAHVHANTPDHVFLDIAQKDNFELLSINVDYPDFPTIATQAEVAHALQAADPARFHFATTFSMKGFGGADWTQTTNQRINEEFARGAIAVKVWKNIGMVEKDAAGHHIMLDDPGFDGVMANIEAHDKVLIAHQAEPKNCWLPLDQMTTENDRSYFRDHPEYYMYLHPEEPSYETLIAARDRFVARHPKLSFDGAHMASLEWSVDELARFLDRYPNANVDLAARMTQVQYQSVRDFQKVRNFFIRYQDRLMYGSDLSENPDAPDAKAQNPPVTRESFRAEADTFWRSDWKYLATDKSQRIDAINANAPGLALPRSVIDKIYYGNARRIFHLR